MVIAPPRPPIQESLIPKPRGDYRLLVPGFAGELAQAEFEFIQDRLIRDKGLARLWGFKPSSKRRTETAIRALAAAGDSSSSRVNARLAREPIPGTA